MNPSTFESYQAASKLQAEAAALLNAIEAQADAGARKAEALLNAAWMRYNRRATITNRAAYQHWGDL